MLGAMNVESTGAPSSTARSSYHEAGRRSAGRKSVATDPRKNAVESRRRRTNTSAFDQPYREEVEPVCFLAGRVDCAGGGRGSVSTSDGPVRPGRGGEEIRLEELIRPPEMQDMPNSGPEAMGVPT